MKEHPTSNWGNVLRVACCVLLGLVCIAATVPILNGLLQSDLNGGGFCINNLGCLNVGTINSVTLNTTNLYATNANIQNLTVSNVTVTSINGATPTAIAIESGTVLSPLQGTNYLIDFNSTNASGQTNVYGSIDASNNVNIVGFTNGGMWKLFSVNIVAHKGDRTITVTNAWRNTNDIGGSHFSTNGAGSSGQGWAAAGNSFTYVLSNHNALQITWQSNAPAPCADSNQLYIIWTPVGQ